MATKEESGSNDLSTRPIYSPSSSSFPSSPSVSVSASPSSESPGPSLSRSSTEQLAQKDAELAAVRDSLLLAQSELSGVREELALAEIRLARREIDRAERDVRRIVMQKLRRGRERDGLRGMTATGIRELLNNGEGRFCPGSTTRDAVLTHNA